MVYRNVDEELLKKLRDHQAAEEYLFQALEECQKMDKKRARQHLVPTLKILRKAQGSWVCDNKFGNFFYRIAASIRLKLYKSPHSWRWKK